MLTEEYLRLNWSPYKFQEVGLKWIAERRENGLRWTPLFMCTGSGKSVVALEDMMRAAERGARKYLIVAPFSVVGDWLDKAQEYNVPLRFQRVKRLMTREAKIRLIKSPYWDVLVINYETLRMCEAELTAIGFDYLIFDESQALKNHKAKVTLAARNVSRSVKAKKGVRLALSGTPAPKDCLDFWSTFDVLDPYSDERIEAHHPLGLGSYRSFEHLVSYSTSHPRLKNVQIVTFPEPMLELVRQRVAAHAYQVSKAEALPFLPPQRFERVLVDMTEGQAKLYNIMKEDAVAAITGKGVGRSARITAENIMPLEEYLADDSYAKDREALKQGLVTAKIETVVMMRLHQITCGHVGTADGNFRVFDNGKEEYLLDNLPQWCDPAEDNKAIIFTAYRPSVQMLIDMAEKANVGALALIGGMKDDAQTLVRQFQNDPGARLFVINIAAGNSGITLTRANRVCYFASTYNWGHRRQSEDRAHRIGQTRSVLYTDLQIRNSIEQHVSRKLEKKGDMVARTTTSFLEMFE